MRIFAAVLSTESNTFAPWPTGARGFVEIDAALGQACESSESVLLAQMRDRAAREGHELVTGLIAFAEPSGPTVHSVYEKYRERIVADLLARGPFDIVLLFLHGAMISTACDDCEGDLISHIRRRVSRDLVLGMELDPHCHLTQEMMTHSDAIVLMKEYPHTDFIARAEELYRICVDARAGKVRPVAAVFDCRMVGFYPTTTEPMAGLLRYLREEESQPGILSISFVHGFPWGDSPEAGSKVLVIADFDKALAVRTAERVGRAIYAKREALRIHMPDMDTALRQCASTPGRVVLADTADNAGGGAPSDNVSFLRAMFAHSIRDAAFGCIWDPISVTACMDAGAGAMLPLRIGGKCGTASGDPLDLVVTVRAIAERHDQQDLGGSRVPLGASVWVEANGIDIVINSIRTQTLSPDAFTGLGIDLTAKKVIAVKSTQHFRAAFAPLADKLILVATPGCLQMDFAALSYRKKLDMDFFPRIPAPMPGNDA